MSLSSLPQHDEPLFVNTPLQSAKAPLVLALVLTAFAIAPLFYPGYIQTHQGFVALWNVVDLRANFGDWQWLPHVATSFDPLRSDGLWPFYLAAILPFAPAVAIKGVVGLGWLLGSAGTFLWLKSWLGRPGAVVAALVYTYLPYHIATVYVRGAWGEAFFWGLLPWAMLATGKSAPRRGQELPVRRSSLTLAFLTAILWLILGLSQLGLTLWAFIFMVLFSLFTQGRQVIWPSLFSLLGTVLAVVISLSVLFAAPLAASSPRLPFHFSDHFLYPFQLFSAYWGYGPSRAGWNDGLSFQLGLAAVGLTGLSIILWRQRRPGNLKSSFTDRHMIFFAGAAIFLGLLQFSFAAPFWQIPLSPGHSLASTLTYPWQLLGLIGLCLAVLAGVGLGFDEQLTRLPLFGSILMLVVLSSYPYLSPHFIQLDQAMLIGPQAQLGSAQVSLLPPDFSVVINGNTAGLERGPTTIPLARYGLLQAGTILRLNVTWQPHQAFAEDWKVFVHLVDPQGTVLAQFDGQPLEGAYPTSQWLPGELIDDSYPLVFPDNAPAGPYQVYIGFYNEATGARLPIADDAEGRVVLNVE